MSANKPTKAPERFIRLLKKAMDEHPERPSLREVARRADLSPAFLSYLLSGDRGVPTNVAIARLEEVLNLPKGDLFKAAGKPNDEALDFFRKEEAGPIMRTLANVPNRHLPQVHKLIERFLKNAAFQQQMKYTTKQVLHIMTAQLQLKVKFVDYFPDGTHGRLIPREKRILVNAHAPRYEHIFTILHEIAHYVVHVLNANLLPLPWYLKRGWKSTRVAKMVSLLKRYVRFMFSTKRSKEKQADLWAFMAFFLVAKCAGTSKEFRAFIDHHPEKFWTLCLASLAVTYGGIKTRLQNISHKLFIPFRILCKS